MKKSLFDGKKRNFSLFSLIFKPKQLVYYNCFLSKKEFQFRFEKLLSKKTNSKTIFGCNEKLYSGNFEENRFEITTEFLLKINDDTPYFRIIGSFAENDCQNGCHLSVFYDIKNKRKIYIVLMILPAAIFLSSFFSNVFFSEFFLALVIYLILDLGFFLYSSRVTKESKKFFEKYFDLKTI